MRATIRPREAPAGRTKPLAIALLAILGAALLALAMEAAWRAVRARPAPAIVNQPQATAPPRAPDTWRSMIANSRLPRKDFMQRYHLTEKDLDHRVKVKAKNRQMRLGPVREFEANFPLQAKNTASSSPESPQDPTQTGLRREIDAP